MWLSRPIYELLPYLYMLIGIVLAVASYLVNDAHRSSWLLGGAGLAMLVGLVFWLKRKDYRRAQREYNRRSLDE